MKDLKATCDFCHESFVPGAVAVEAPKDPNRKSGRRNNHRHCAACWEWVCTMSNSYLFSHSDNRPWSAIELMQREGHSRRQGYQPLTPGAIRKVIGGQAWEECREGIFASCTIEQCNRIAELSGSTPVLVFSKIQAANERLARWYEWSKRIGWKPTAT